MKTIQKLRIFSKTSLFSPSSARISFYHFSSSPQIQAQHSSDTTQEITATLTKEEITQMNLLIPRLCSTNHLKEATDLITTALLTNPPLKSLSLSIFIQGLTMEPDLTQSMYFLNKIKHNPKIQSFLKPITRMLAYSYFQKDQAKWALKIFHWVSRNDFPCGCVDMEFYGVLVNGFCKYSMVLEALKVLRVMVSQNLVVGDEFRMCIYRALLREARIRDAQALNDALKTVCKDAEGNEKVVKLLDDMITNWVE